MRPVLVSCYGFKVKDGSLKIPLANRQYFDIQLNKYARIIINSSLRIRSFTLTADAPSICISKEVEEIECASTEGVDRNLRNLTVGNCQQVRQYDLLEAADIAENTLTIIRSFKRNDVRIRRKLYAKYGNRRMNRTRQLLHRVSKAMVQDAKLNETAIAFEDICHICRLYQRGNYQSNSYRDRMNSGLLQKSSTKLNTRLQGKAYQSFNYPNQKPEAHHSSVLDAGRR